MQLTKIGDNSVATSEDFETMSFGISQENIGLILETLRSKMYSNPIAAVCREVASNCRDSHREAGKPEEPVEISISAGDVFMGVDEQVGSTINFIDRGVGISPDRIKNIYLLFGASTKRSDNNQTGGFGYGAKTPFAYSDTFAVITNYNGKKYTYFFSIGENRRGDAYLISEVDTTDPNGTTVSIPLKEEDRSKFEYELIRATYFWDVPPKFTGRFSESLKMTFENRDNTILFKKSKFMMANDQSPTAFRKFGFIIDGIYYDYTTTKELESFKNLVESTARNSKVFLRFNTGEVTISTNRESLFYDKKTIELILRNSKEYASTLKKEYIRGIQRFETYYVFAEEMTNRHRRYNANTQTPENAKLHDLYQCLIGFDPKFIAKCTKKYFGFVKSPFATPHRYSDPKAAEDEYLQAVDQYVQIHAFGAFSPGEKREKRRTQNFSQIKESLIDNSKPIFTHPSHLERDSIKKNLTIFDDKGKWSNHNWYHVMIVPRLDKSFLTQARNTWRAHAQDTANEIAKLDPNDRQYDYNKSQLKSTLDNDKRIFREVLYQRKILSRIFSEIRVMRQSTIPTYDSIPETKISRTARALEKNAFRVVEQFAVVNHKNSNDTREIKINKDSASYIEVKLSEQTRAIIIPTKSNNVYQIQTEIRNASVYASHLYKIVMLFTEMFPGKSQGVKIIYAKAQDYPLMKTIDIKTRDGAKVYKVDDLLKKAVSEFDDIRVSHLMKSYHKLIALEQMHSGNYSDLAKFCDMYKSKIHRTVLSQKKLESKLKTIREKNIGYHGVNLLYVLTDDWIAEKARRDQSVSFPITGFHDFFANNSDYKKLFDLFKKHYDNNKVEILSSRKNLKTVFRRHYGAFVEDIISNYYRPGGYRDNNVILVGVLKLIRQIDKKYETFSKKK